MERPGVVIVDRQLVADGFVKILQEQFTVLGVVNNVSSMLDTVLERRPSIVTLEMSLNGSVAAAAQLRQQLPGTRLVIVTHESDRYALTTALRLGAVGFVLKQQSAAEFCQALRTVANGRTYIAPQMRNEALLARAALRGKRGEPEGNITGRQSEVLQLVAKGKTMKEIAALLGISPKTAEFHKAGLMDGLGIRTTAELTRFAIEHGFLGLH
jgi:DNA-binding NarL/FixJ family response regulator